MAICEALIAATAVQCDQSAVSLIVTLLLKTHFNFHFQISTSAGQFKEILFCVRPQD